MRVTRPRLIASLWIAGVAFVSLQSHRPPQTPALHRLFHFAVFAATAVILRTSIAGRRPLLRATLVAVTVGVALELLQTQMRYPIEWWDVRDDAIGVLIGAIVWQAASRLRGSAPNSRSKGALERAL